MQHFNLTLFHFVNDAAGYYLSLDVFMIFLTTYLAWMVSIATILYIVVWIPIRHAQPLDRLKNFAQAGEFVFSIGASWIVVETIKILIAHERPAVVFADAVNVLVQQSGYSFPSAHAALTTALATTTYLYHKRLGVFLFLFAFVIGLSRIYVGVHYPIDVLVGILLGILIPYGVHRVFKK